MGIALRKLDYKVLISTIFLVIFSFFILNSALAYSVTEEPLGGVKDTGSKAGYKDDAGGTDNPSEGIAVIVGQIIGVAVSLLGVLFFILGLMGALDIMGANGNDELVVKGKERIKTAFIGMVLILSAYFISRLFVSFLGQGVFTLY